MVGVFDTHFGGGTGKEVLSVVDVVVPNKITAIIVSRIVPVICFSFWV